MYSRAFCKKSSPYKRTRFMLALSIAVSTPLFAADDPIIIKDNGRSNITFEKITESYNYVATNSQQLDDNQPLGGDYRYNNLVVHEFINNQEGMLSLKAVSEIANEVKGLEGDLLMASTYLGSSHGVQSFNLSAINNGVSLSNINGDVKGAEVFVDYSLSGLNRSVVAINERISMEDSDALSVIGAEVGLSTISLDSFGSNDGPTHQQKFKVSSENKELSIKAENRQIGAIIGANTYLLEGILSAEEAVLDVSIVNHLISITGGEIKSVVGAQSMLNLSGDTSGGKSSNTTIELVSKLIETSDIESVSLIGAKNNVTEIITGELRSRSAKIQDKNSQIAQIIGAETSTATNRYQGKDDGVKKIEVSSLGGEIWLNGTTVQQVYGAKTTFKDAYSDNGMYETFIKSTGTKITLEGDIKFLSTLMGVSDRRELFGGEIHYELGSYLDLKSPEALKYVSLDAFTGNSLTFASKPIEVDRMGNFEHYLFTINQYNSPSIVKEQALITVTEEIRNDLTEQISVNRGELMNATAGGKSNISIQGIANDGIISIGDKITLLDAKTAQLYQAVLSDGTKKEVALSDLFRVDDEPKTAQVGLIYDAKINYVIDDENSIITAEFIEESPEVGFTVNKAAVAKLKVLSEARLASVESINQGNNLIIDQLSHFTENWANNALNPIIGIEADKTKYKSGSHVKSTGINGIIGLGYKYDDFDFGGFIGYGQGDYDTYNGFESATDVTGKGKARHWSVGIFTKYHAGGDYFIEGSLRAGKSKDRYDNFDVISGGGYAIGYDEKSTFYAAHIGTGISMPLSDISSLEGTMRYFYTTVDGFDRVVDGSNISTGSINSSRVQLGGRYNYQVEDSVKLFAGLMADLELGNEPKVVVDGYDIDRASVKGMTGIIETGLLLTPGKMQKNLEIDLKLRGYIGKRQGISGGMTLRYYFNKDDF